MKKKITKVLLASFLVFGLTGVANAGPIHDSEKEVKKFIAGGTDVVTGTLSTSADVDMYGFGWGGGGFYVSSVGTSWDSQLFLFYSNGLGVQANDDGIAIAGPAYLQLSSLAAGNYLLGISGYNVDPYDSNGDLMFQSSPVTPLYGPQTSAPISSWKGPGYNYGDYTITFASITDTGDIIATNPTTEPNAPVPEPATLILFSTGLIGLIGVARRKKK